MDRREAVLRELNLYPQWVRKNPPVSVLAVQPVHVEEVIIPIIATVAAPFESAASEQTSVPVSHVDKLNWPELKQRVRDCNACELRAGCTQTVFGAGDEQADWLFVGEGPGADEDALGEPFAGEAGKLLDNMLLAIKLKRGKNVYIANAVKCRPPNNRNPEADEIAQCLPFLRRQIELIQPKIIVALGKVASNALLNKDATIASLQQSHAIFNAGETPHENGRRGMVHDYHGIPLIVTYHPAYLLRNPSEKAKAWQDLCLAVKTLDGDK